MNKHSIGIILIIVLQIFIVVNLISLNSEIKSLKDMNMALSDRNYDLENRIDALGDKLDEKASLLSDFNIVSGDINTKTYKYPLTINAVLKEYKDDDEVFVNVNGELIALERNGNSFQTIIQADSRLKYDINSLIIKSDGISKAQKIKRNNNPLTPHIRTLFARIRTHVKGEVSFGGLDNNGLAPVKFGEEFDIEIENKGRQLGVNDISYLVKIDDDIVFEGKITEPEEEFKNNNILINNAYFKFDKRFEVKKDQTLYLILNAKYQDGFTYERVLESYNPSKETKNSSGVTGEYVIKDKDGNVVIDSSKH